MILVGHPEHAVFYWTIFHARWRPGAPRAALGDNCKFFWFFLARGGDPFGARFVLLFVGHHPGGFRDFALSGHEFLPFPLLPSYFHTCTAQWAPGSPSEA